MQKILLGSLGLLGFLSNSVSAEWLNGLNVPVKKWGEDFGKSYDQGWWKNNFAKY